MRFKKKLVISAAWVIGFFIISATFSALDLTADPKATASSLAGNTLFALAIGLIGLMPLVMAVLVWFNRPRKLYGNKPGQNRE
jgi:hypothetical protein